MSLENKHTWKLLMNAFSAGCKLACIALSRGKVVAKVNMYGIVATMKDQCGSKIVHLEIDFINSKCHFSILINKI